MSKPVPNFIKGDHERELWRKPWKVGLPSSESADFKRKLRSNGYLSPHFKIEEAASKAGANCPRELPQGADLTRAQFHAFNLERVRHEVGDKPMSPLSWYRSPCHNAEVGGASQSQHMEGWATDWSDATRASVGATAFDRAMSAQFANGGIGVVGGGPQVRHVDNGPRRRWSY